MSIGTELKGIRGLGGGYYQKNVHPESEDLRHNQELLDKTGRDFGGFQVCPHSAIIDICAKLAGFEVAEVVDAEQYCGLSYPEHNGDFTSHNRRVPSLVTMCSKVFQALDRALRILEIERPSQEEISTIESMSAEKRLAVVKQLNDFEEGQRILARLREVLPEIEGGDWESASADQVRDQVFTYLQILVEEAVGEPRPFSFGLFETGYVCAQVPRGRS